MDYIIDAHKKRLGRLASEIAEELQGKRSAAYHPRLAGEGKVIVKNVRAMEIGGAKFTQKVYYRHTGYMGHLRSRTYREEFLISPARVLLHAVSHMLPKNRLRAVRMKRLVIEP